MHCLQIEDGIVALDEDGFLVEPRDWNEGIAIALARMDGVGPLTDEHWAVIRCIRVYFETYDAPPMVRLVSKRTGLGAERLAELFLTQCRDCMCRIAGLPKPTG